MIAMAPPSNTRVILGLSVLAATILIPLILYLVFGDKDD